MDRPCGNQACENTLKPDQGAYCSKDCRIAGLRAANQARAKRVEPQEDEHEPVHKDDAVDRDAKAATVLAAVAAHNWRRPQEAMDAMESYHRRARP